MSIPTFVVVFSGNVLDGFDLIQVKERMARLIRADEDKMATLFSGKTIVIKRSTDKNDAYKVMTALKAVGADARIRLIKEETAEAESTGSTDDAQSDASDSPLSLTANVGYLVDPVDPVPAPDLDLSSLTVASIDDTSPLQDSNFKHASISESVILEKVG